VPVAAETIVEALKEMEKLEQFTLENLIEVSRDRFSPFPRPLRAKILSLLSALKDDTGEHQKIILKIVARLIHETSEKGIRS
jgi:hypothetical protein